MSIPDLPPPQDEDARVAPRDRPVAFVAVIGGGVCLFTVIVGLVLMGVDHDSDVTDTGLAAIGSALAGGFAGWIARGQAHGDRRE